MNWWTRKETPSKKFQKLMDQHQQKRQKAKIKAAAERDYQTELNRQRLIQSLKNSGVSPRDTLKMDLFYPSPDSISMMNPTRNENDLNQAIGTPSPLSDAQPYLVRCLGYKVNSYYSSHSMNPEGQIEDLPLEIQKQNLNTDITMHEIPGGEVIPMYLWSDGVITWSQVRPKIITEQPSTSLTPGEPVPVPKFPEVWWDAAQCKLFFKHNCLGTEYVDPLPTGRWSSESGDDFLSVSPAIKCERCGTHGWWRGNVWTPVT